MNKTKRILESILKEIDETTVALDRSEETWAYESGIRYVRFIIERYLKQEKEHHFFGRRFL